MSTISSLTGDLAQVRESLARRISMSSALKTVLPESTSKWTSCRTAIDGDWTTGAEAAAGPDWLFTRWSSGRLLATDRAGPLEFPDLDPPVIVATAHENLRF